MSACVRCGRYSAVVDEWNCSRAQTALRICTTEKNVQNNITFDTSPFVSYMAAKQKLQVKTEARKSAWRFTLKTYIDIAYIHVVILQAAV